jgi:hypothetical protein
MKAVVPLTLTIMAGLLAVGVFFENFARTRAYRTLDREITMGANQAAQLRYRLADQTIPDTSLILSAFRMPISVRAAPVGSIVLTLVNAAVFVVIANRYPPTGLNPTDWPGYFTAGAILLSVHVALGLLALKGYQEMAEDQRRERRRFGDGVVKDLRSEIVGSIRAATHWTLESVNGATPLFPSVAAADMLLLENTSLAAARMSDLLLPHFLKSAWLTEEGKSEAESLRWISRCYSVRISELEGDRDTSWRGTEQFLADVEPYLGRHVAEGSHESNHFVLRLLAMVSISESLLTSRFRFAFGKNREADEAKARELERVASDLLRTAALLVNRTFPTPPLWLYTRRKELWAKAAGQRSSEGVTSGLMRLIVRAYQVDPIPSTWIEIAAELCRSPLVGRSGIYGLATMLAAERLRGSRYSAPTSLISLEDGDDASQSECPSTRSAVGPAHELGNDSGVSAAEVDTSMHLALAYYLGLRSVDLDEEAEQLLVKCATKWRNPVSTIAEAEFLATARFGEPIPNLGRIITAGYTRAIELPELPEAHFVVTWMHDLLEVDSQLGPAPESFMSSAEFGSAFHRRGRLSNALYAAVLAIRGEGLKQLNEDDGRLLASLALQVEKRFPGYMVADFVRIAKDVALKPRVGETPV